MAMELALSLKAPEDVYDVLIIGGGPGGLTAALYAARAKLRTLVIDKNPRAGALAMTELIANYPGVDEEISGADLLSRFRNQAQNFGAELVQAQVLATDLSSDPKTVITSQGTYQGRTVIIAAGALGRTGSIPGERELVGRGVSYCAACDAAFFQGKDVAVIGDSRELPDELELIARFARRVYLIPGESWMRGDGPRWLDTPTSICWRRRGSNGSWEIGPSPALRWSTAARRG